MATPNTRLPKPAVKVLQAKPASAARQPQPAVKVLQAKPANSARQPQPAVKVLQPKTAAADASSRIAKPAEKVLKIK